MGEPQHQAAGTAPEGETKRSIRLLVRHRLMDAPTAIMGSQLLDLLQSASNDPQLAVDISIRREARALHDRAGSFQRHRTRWIEKTGLLLSNEAGVHP